MKAFFGTTLGKVLIGVLAGVVGAASGYGIYQATQSGPAPATEITAEETAATEAPEITDVTTAGEEVIEAPTEAPTVAPPPPAFSGLLTGKNTPGTFYAGEYGENPEAQFKWKAKELCWEYPLDAPPIHGELWDLQGYLFQYDNRGYDTPPNTETGIHKGYICPGDRLYKIG